MTIDAQIESILFFTGDSFSVDELANMLGASSTDVLHGLELLRERLVGRGVALITTDTTVSLATVPEAHTLIKQIQTMELDKELSKASLETLSVILYKKTPTRAEIDYIRGVNSSFILRNLQLRGLIEKKIDQKDSRRFMYMPTTELLSFLGITQTSDLQDYESISHDLTAAFDTVGAKEN